ncbi:VWA domain-containing protein [Gordonia sp. LSe1-13]|uniref:VWA domain-containing protein n=1 Tax=Gordonia sesuvii TaxID=3116777 RepID=A0ABU7MF86_9ACTN|nr:VWA domain-containing protein [Gordonia sp. LSe1-13]
MKLSAALDVEVVAHEAADEVTVLLELEAPAGPDTNRTPTALQVVLDRSGSMSGPPLDGARKALAGVVAQLDPSDVFGVVTFDDDAQVVVPAAALTDKQRATDAINSISAGGCTDLSSGYLRGLQELRRGTTAGIRGGTVLVISDGHVNRGIQDLDEFASITAKAAADGIVTSTLGYGRGYDETLLSAISRSGNGNHVFADDPDAAGAAIAGEVEGLLAKSAQAVTLTVRYVPQVQALSLYNDLPAHQTADGEVMIELGDLYALEARKLLLRMKVDGLASLGLAQIASLELRYVETATLTEHTVSLPISVNVVPGDELGDRVPDPKVQSERLYQEGQAAKLEASQAYETGDLDGGLAHMRESRDRLRAASVLARPEDRAAIDMELSMIEEVSAEAPLIGSIYASKATRDSYHLGNRKRGRRRS